jgi:hypothetical protein
MKKFLMILAVMMCIFVYSSFASVVIPDYNWVLNINYLDHLGHYTGTPEAVQQAHITNSTIFGGTGYLNLDGTTDFIKLRSGDSNKTLNGSFSVRAWFIHNVSIDDCIITYIREGDGNIEGYKLCVMASNKIQVALYNGTGAGSVTFNNSNDTINIGTVYAVHFTFNVTDSMARIYLNGTLTTKWNTTGKTPTFGYRMCQAIGAELYNLTGTCNNIDKDFMGGIWNVAEWHGYALTQTEVYSDFINRTEYGYYTSFVKINIYDEKNLSLLIGSPSIINIISPISTFNLTNIYGTANFSINNTNDSTYNYEFILTNPGYKSRTKYIDMRGFSSGYDENYTISMYLLSSTISSDSIIKAIDENGKTIPYMKVIIYRENPLLFNSFYVVNELFTNFEGQTIHDFERNSSIYYKFEFLYNNITLSMTDKTLIFQDILTHQVQLTQSQILSLNYFLPAITYMTPISNSSGIYLEVNYSFSGGNLKGGKVEVKKTIFNTNSEIVASNSSTASFGMLNVKWIPEQNARYFVSGYIDTNTAGSWYPTDNIEYFFQSNPFKSYGVIGLFIAMLFIGFFALLNTNNYSLTIVMTIISLGICSMIGFVSITWGTLVFLACAGGLIIFSRQK